MEWKDYLAEKLKDDRYKREWDALEGPYQAVSRRIRNRRVRFRLIRRNHNGPFLGAFTQITRTVVELAASAHERERELKRA